MFVMNELAANEGHDANITSFSATKNTIAEQDSSIKAANKGVLWYADEKPRTEYDRKAHLEKKLMFPLSVNPK